MFSCLMANNTTRLDAVCDTCHWRKVSSPHHKSNQPTNLTTLSPCHREEADTRMMLYLHHAAEQGHTKACLRAVDMMW